MRYVIYAIDTRIYFDVREVRFAETLKEAKEWKTYFNEQGYTLVQIEKDLEV